MKGKTIESKVADAILQKADEITIRGKVYSVAPPSVATLILASEAISQLPQTSLNSEKIVEESLYIAKECRALGEIAAILILGAKGLTEQVKVKKAVPKLCLFGLFRWHKRIEVEVMEDRKARLARELLEDLTPRELNQLVARLLQKMELGDFFGLTTFLFGINLLRETKVETKKTTASGQ